MSDIVERLRVRRNPMLDGEREEAADEIERLRVAYEQERQDCINLTEKVIPNLRAEIEYLRARVKSLRECLETIDQAARECGYQTEQLPGLIIDLCNDVFEACHD
jgi:hypothetical protein